MKKLISIFIMVMVISACQSLNLKQKPTAKIEKFDIESISLKDITLLFDISIKNPYPLGIKLDDIKLTFFIEKKQLFKTKTSKGLKIKSRGKKSSRFHVNLKYKDIMKIVKSYSKKDSLDCVVDVVIIIPLPKLPGLKKNISFNYKLKKKIPAFKPSIKIVNFKVKKPSLSNISKALKKTKKNLLNKKKIHNMFTDIFSGKKPKKIIKPSSIDVKLDVSFDIELKNNTKAKLLFKNLNYDFMVNSNKLVKGSTKDFKTSGNKSILRVNNSFSSKALGKAILKAFSSKKGSFKLQGHAMVKFPDIIKKEPLKLKFDEIGKLLIK
ncbi:LEA type 2 family protein [Spirochaetota bacterium]